mmetsp:Transcript_11563/g.16601  ORF Transcript_11563/g.16601 Transcript_11563/m.16601 type:complete len:330 (+) Transcript_11563:30-1019(+)
MIDPQDSTNSSILHAQLSNILNNHENSLTQAIHSFRTDGFTILETPILDRSSVDLLNVRIEHVLRGIYDRGHCPDKTPPLLTTPITTTTTTEPLGYSFTAKTHHPQDRNVLQIVNIHKCDSAFRSLATNSQLGELIAKLTGWEEGVRLASDQTWLKCPGSKPLSFHRDSPYFMFTPSDVVTVWVALDDIMVDDSSSMGPLEYVRGSHLWGNNTSGGARQFFQKKGSKLLHDAAQSEGRSMECLEFVSTKGLRAGAISIHNGKTWHGSGKNTSTKPRRGLGLHYVPAQVKFTEEARSSSLWRRYLINVEDEAHNSASEVILNKDDFPVIF